MTNFQNPEQVISLFDDYNLDEKGQKYLRFHAQRYQILYAEVVEILSRTSNNTTLKILDIGPGFFTEILGQKLTEKHKNLELFGLGLKSDYIPFKSKVQFIQLDLNDLYLKPDTASQIVQSLPQFDLIICAEVLEHLYTGIDSSLESFVKWLKPSGFLLIQTPNAISLHHRLRLFFGKNPFPLLRPDPSEPGHYREYTLEELKISLKRVGLNPIKTKFHNYFNYKGGWKNDTYKTICNIFPQSFRDGVTISVEKCSDSH